MKHRKRTGSYKNWEHRPTLYTFRCSRYLHCLDSSQEKGNPMKLFLIMKNDTMKGVAMPIVEKDTEFIITTPGMVIKGPISYMNKFRSISLWSLILFIRCSYLSQLVRQSQNQCVLSYPKHSNTELDRQGNWQSNDERLKRRFPARRFSQR